MQIEDMRLGDVLKLMEALEGGPEKSAAIDHGMAIVVLDRGFVYVGRVSTDGDWCRIADARNIRYWGTTRGLGQLVREGPTATTKLDDVGCVMAPTRAVISILPIIQEGAWKRS